MESSTLDHALAHADDVTTLIVRKNEESPWQRVVPRLPKLEALILLPGVNVDPQGVGVRGLFSLTLALDDIAELSAAWVGAAPGLTELVLRQRTPGPAALPAFIGDWPWLRRLTIHSRGPVALPSTLVGGPLRDLSLTGPAGPLPTGVLALSQLEALALHQRFDELPDDLATLTGLRVLDLAYGLNDDPLDAVYTWDELYRPLPAVVGRLPALEDLRLDACAIFERDIEVLAGHERISRLSLRYAGLQDLSGLRALPGLRALGLQDCINVSDLGPLRGLPLEELDIAATGVDDLSPLAGLARLRRLDIRGLRPISLVPVLTHPSLDELRGDDAQLAPWRRRDELAGLSPEALRAGVSSTDPAARAAALGGLARWVEITSGADRNALVDIFGLDPDGADDSLADNADGIAIPELSSALADPDLDPALAAGVFRACLRPLTDSFIPALDAAEIVVERGTEDDQLVLVRALLQARASSGAGRGQPGRGLLDRLLDDVVPRLRPPALAELLDRLSDDQLHSNGLTGLFVPALATADDAVRHRLEQRLRVFAGHALGYLGAAWLASFFEPLHAVDPGVEERMADVIPSMACLEHARRLEQASGDTEARLALADFVAWAGQGGTTSRDLDVLQRSVLRARKRVEGELDPDLAWAVLELAVTLETAWLLDDSVFLPLLAHRPDALIGLEAPARGMVTARLASLHRVHLDWEGTGLLAVRAALEGLSETEMRRRMFVDALDFAMKNGHEGLADILRMYARAPTTLVTPDFPSRRLGRRLAAWLDFQRLHGRWDAMVEVMDLLYGVRDALGWDPVDEQYPLTYLLPIAVERGPDVYAEHVEIWLDRPVVDARLAFNIACYAARHADTPTLCSAIQRALELGKPPAQFVEDGDFANRLDEAEVRRLLGLDGPA